MRSAGERRGKFRNKLQYFYSIGVFAGVLSTAYLMMEKQENTRFSLDAVQNPNSYRLEAGVGDDALARLIEVENELNSLKERDTKSSKRLIDSLRNITGEPTFFRESNSSNGN